MSVDESQTSGAISGLPPCVESNLLEFLARPSTAFDGCTLQIAQDQGMPEWAQNILRRQLASKHKAAVLYGPATSNEDLTTKCGAIEQLAPLARALGAEWTLWLCNGTHWLIDQTGGIDSATGGSDTAVDVSSYQQSALELQIKENDDGSVVIAFVPSDIVTAPAHPCASTN